MPRFPLGGGHHDNLEFPFPFSLFPFPFLLFPLPRSPFPRSP